MQWKSHSAAPRPSPAVAHSRAVAGKLSRQIALAHALLLSRPPACVGQCRSSCGGGAGLGRVRYTGGPWGGGGRLAERGLAARVAGQTGGGSGCAAFRTAGARVPAGWVAGRFARLGPDAVVTTNLARGTDGLFSSGY